MSQNFQSAPCALTGKELLFQRCFCEAKSTTVRGWVIDEQDGVSDDSDIAKWLLENRIWERSIRWMLQST